VSVSSASVLGRIPVCSRRTFRSILRRGRPAFRLNCPFIVLRRNWGDPSVWGFPKSFPPFGGMEGGGGAPMNLSIPLRPRTRVRDPRRSGGLGALREIGARECPPNGRIAFQA
jgi:hypothetical protein